MFWFLRPLLCKRPTPSPTPTATFQLDRIGNNSSIRLFGQTGNFSSVSLSQAQGSMPFSLAVPNRLCIAAARLPARSDPANKQFFLPMAMGRSAFSTGLLHTTKHAGRKRTSLRKDSMDGVGARIFFNRAEPDL